MSLPSLPVIELPVTAFRLELTRWLAAVEQGERLVVTIGRRPVAVVAGWPRHELSLQEEVPRVSPPASAE